MQPLIRITAGVVCPSMVMPTLRPPRLAHRLARVARHPGDGRGGIVEHRARDRIEAEDVDDRMHDEDVALADEGAERPPARRAWRNDQLGHADGKGVHGGRAEQCALGAAETQDSVDPPLQPEPKTDGAYALDHQLDRRAATSSRLHVLEVVAGLASDVVRVTTSAVMPGSPRMPESITSGFVPSAISRSRT